MAPIRPLVCALVSTVIVLTFSRNPQAAEDKTVKGKATAVTNVSLTVKVGDRDWTFDVDSRTVVRSDGAGRPMAGNQPIGSSGKLTSLIQAGDLVAVTYRDVKGRNLAVEITRNPIR